MLCALAVAFCHYFIFFNISVLSFPFFYGTVQKFVTLSVMYHDGSQFFFELRWLSVQKLE